MSWTPPLPPLLPRPPFIHSPLSSSLFPLSSSIPVSLVPIRFSVHLPACPSPFFLSLSSIFLFHPFSLSLFPSLLLYPFYLLVLFPFTLFFSLPFSYLPIPSLLFLFLILFLSFLLFFFIPFIFLFYLLVSSFPFSRLLYYRVLRPLSIPFLSLSLPSLLLPYSFLYHYH